MKQKMKLFTFLFFFCLMFFAATAQQKHFIYVQSDDKQPFAVVLEGKVYSSSDYGYVIVPKLADGTYNFTVSFPLNKFPDQAFTCIINKKDAGFILKNNSDGWALENMQTKKLIVNNTNTVAQKNAFGDMLSEVVSDSNLTKKNVAAEQPVDSLATAVITTPAEQVQDTVASNTSSEIVTDSMAPLEKISESKADTGTNMTFVDKTQGGVDTISVFVPADSLNNNNTTQQNVADTSFTVFQQTDTASMAQTQNENAAIKTDTAEITQLAKEDVNSNINQPVEDTSKHVVSNPFYKSEESNKSNQNNSSEKEAIQNVNSVQSNQTQTVSTSNAVRQDCASMISDDDLNKVKRKMFVQGNNNEMIQYAVKAMGRKCITTEQVKALGNLFSSDDGRYSLYDALYNYVYDYGNYPVLANQILDPYYKKRFAALLR